jgi:DNA invertase Pin-like site-specific DNA recombinase
MSGQLALATSEQVLVPAAVWETLPPERRSRWRCGWRGCWRGRWRRSPMSDRQKITEAHRRRRAVVYVRQSTPTQVLAHAESRARQYRLRERAVELGWPEARVAVVDGDLGRLGASAEGRIGFKELVAEVGLGQVGLVLALEVSRLARSSADWHQLLDLCALTGTLIADSDGIYSPQDFNDRLLLGLKGTMSEAELHLIRSRLDGGLRSRAERGELETSLPVGLDRDEEGRIVLSPDEQVRHAIARVFELWRRVGSARQVVSELVTEGQKLPAAGSGSDGSAGPGRAMRRCTTCSPTPPMRARSCSAAPASRSSSTPTGGCGAGRSSCRWRSGPSACPTTIRAMCPGTSTSPPASGCGPT